ncbi:MAG: hypothetical protein ACJ8FS_16470 [Sphingomicrobium sp.]
MRQIRPGVYVDEPLPANTTVIDKFWHMQIVLPQGMPLPMSVSINDTRYVPKIDASVEPA